MSEEILNNLKNKLTIDGGPFDEGSRDNRNRLGTGSKKYWNTYPGDVYVTPESNDKWYKGNIAVHFSGRERVEDYLAFALRDTNDNNYSGKVVAKYSIDRDNLVFFREIRKEGGAGRIGDATVRHVKDVDSDDLG